MTLKIKYCSDLHLEFRENKHYVARNPIEPTADVLILAGDILLLSMIEDYGDFFDYLSANFSATYWVPGNHEYYRSDITVRPMELNEAIRHNVFLVNRQTIIHGDVAILCCTLWSHIGPLNELKIRQSLSDFSWIANKGNKLSVADYNALHDADLKWLAAELAEVKTQRRVVVTHHVPTLMNYPPKFLGSPTSDAFVTELHDTVAASDAAYWIYGHHHVNIPSFKIGNTELVTNQLGYISHYEHKLYGRNAIIEL